MFFGERYSQGFSGVHHREHGASGVRLPTPPEGFFRVVTDHWPPQRDAFEIPLHGPDRGVETHFIQLLLDKRGGYGTGVPWNQAESVYLSGN